MNLLEFFVRHHREILQSTLEHIWLVGIAMLLAVVVGIPLGVLAVRRPWLSTPILGGANIAETIPSLALFGFLLPIPWLGGRADRLAITALALYALLPIIRNTVAGISGVDAPVREAARGMGMTETQILMKVEFPLAFSTILAGVRVATVLTIGIATIAAAVGAGGLGEFIFRGLAMVNNQLILAGAIPAALLALARGFSTWHPGTPPAARASMNRGPLLLGCLRSLRSQLFALLQPRPSLGDCRRLEEFLGTIAIRRNRRAASRGAYSPARDAQVLSRRLLYLPAGAACGPH